jgi:hypothetical protein
MAVRGFFLTLIVPLTDGPDGPGGGSPRRASAVLHGSARHDGTVAVVPASARAPFVRGGGLGPRPGGARHGSRGRRCSRGGLGTAGPTSARRGRGPQRCAGAAPVPARGRARGSPRRANGGQAGARAPTWAGTILAALRRLATARRLAGVAPTSAPRRTRHPPQPWWRREP